LNIGLLRPSCKGRIGFRLNCLVYIFGALLRRDRSANTNQNGRKIVFGAAVEIRSPAIGSLRASIVSKNPDVSKNPGS